MFWKLHGNGSSMVPRKQFLKFLLTVWSRPKDDKFSQFWKKISQKRLQRIFFWAPRIFSLKIRCCCGMTKRNVKGFGQQLQNKRVREGYVPTIFRHSEVEIVGHLWSEPYVYSPKWIIGTHKESSLKIGYKDTALMLVIA